MINFSVVYFFSFLEVQP